MRTPTPLLALSLLACSEGPQEQARPAVDCGVLPDAFYDPDDPAFWSGKGIPIEPVPVNQITLLRSGKILWNNKETDYRTLTKYLDLISEPGFAFSYTAFGFERGASCAHLTRIRDLMLTKRKCAEERICLKGDYGNWVAESSRKSQ
jgi:hypothetical protein